MSTNEATAPPVEAAGPPENSICLVEDDDDGDDVAVTFEKSSVDSSLLPPAAFPQDVRVSLVEDFEAEADNTLDARQRRCAGCLRVNFASRTTRFVIAGALCAFVTAVLVIAVVYATLDIGGAAVALRSDAARCALHPDSCACIARLLSADGTPVFGPARPPTGGPDAPNAPLPQMPVNLTIAIVGDVQTGPGGRSVYQLIKDEGAEAVIVPGDLDYTDKPKDWDDMINSVLGVNFPVFASVGNHDMDIWIQYQKLLVERWRRADVLKHCHGTVGMNTACSYKGLAFLLSGLGTCGNHTSNDLWLASALAKIQAEQRGPLWRFCSWHKNQKLMQTGTKTDETGWTSYDECRRQGAIILTGHEHSYARTVLLSDFEHQKVSSTNISSVHVQPGKSFAIVSGLGGREVRSGAIGSGYAWWASIWNRETAASFGALICKFNYNGRPHLAYCYFKDVKGRIPDRFYIRVNTLL